MKKVLFLTTHFTPDRHPGAKRVTKFAKHLHAFNYEPYIITKPISDYEGVDESLRSDIVDLKNIYRVSRWRIRRRFTFEKAENTTSKLCVSKNQSFFIKIFGRKVIDLVASMDLLWVIPATLLSIKIVRNENISLIYNSAPDHSTHLIGLFLKIFLGKKWVCEFRDPWTMLHDHFKPSSYFQERIEKKIERYAIKNSDALIAVGNDLMTHLLRNSNRKQADTDFVIHNGYDKEDFKYVIEPKQYGKFTVVYLGTFATRRNPFRFIEAISKLKNRLNNIEESLQINFYCDFRHNNIIEIADRTKKLIEENNLGNIIRINNFIEYGKGLCELIKSHVLLLIIRPEENDNDNNWVVTSKLFQYLYARRPILALASIGGEAARIVKECNAGEVVDPEDVDLIADRVYQLYVEWKENRLRYNYNENEIAKYERKKQVEKLAKIFNSLLYSKKHN